MAGKSNYRGSSDEDEKACLQQRTLNQTDHQLLTYLTLDLLILCFVSGSGDFLKQVLMTFLTAITNFQARTFLVIKYMLKFNYALKGTVQCPAR